MTKPIARETKASKGHHVSTSGDIRLSVYGSLEYRLRKVGQVETPNAIAAGTADAETRAGARAFVHGVFPPETDGLEPLLDSDDGPPNFGRDALDANFQSSEPRERSRAEHRDRNLAWQISVWLPRLRTHARNQAKLLKQQGVDSAKAHQLAKQGKQGDISPVTCPMTEIEARETAFLRVAAILVHWCECLSLAISLDNALAALTARGEQKPAARLVAVTRYDVAYDCLDRKGTYTVTEAKAVEYADKLDSNVRKAMQRG